MNILLLGSGGREHAIALKISQSHLLTQLFIAPGNAGTLQCGINIHCNPTDFETIKNIVLTKNIHMVIVGPENPLVKGIVDYFLNDEILKHIPVIGPSAHAAQLEGSKDFAKAFMMRHNIPTAKYKTINAENLAQGISFLETLTPPYVLKADGLAAGKGVLILNELSEAKKELKEMLLNKKFGEASTQVVIEEFLDGIELSCFVLTDGVNYKVLPEAKDYKRIGEQDTGPNTGGMGAVSPVPFANEAFLKKVEEKIISPTIAGFKKDNINYTGFVFIGLIKVGDEPFVIEYNCRMGDPETEVVIPRIKSDLVEMFKAVANQSLNEYKLEIDLRFATTVMMVSGGYPDAYQKNKIIEGLNNQTESTVFHAGTQIENDVTKTNGGRVLAITSLHNQMQMALKMTYETISKINFEGAYYRKDIGKDLEKFL